jgi:hypothetical protein
MMPRVTQLPSTVLAPDLAEVYEINEPGRIRDATFARLHQHFSEAQIVELTLRIALAGFYNRFNDALQIDDGRTAADGAESFAGVQHPRRSNGP